MDVIKIEGSAKKKDFIYRNHISRGKLSATVSQAGIGSIANSVREAVEMASRGKKILFMFDQFDNKESVSERFEAQSLAVNSNFISVKDATVLYRCFYGYFSDLNSVEELVSYVASEDIDAIFVPVSAIKNSREEMTRISNIAEVTNCGIEIYGMVRHRGSFIDFDNSGLAANLVNVAANVRQFYIHTNYGDVSGAFIRTHKAENCIKNEEIRLKHGFIYVHSGNVVGVFVDEAVDTR